MLIMHYVNNENRSEREGQLISHYTASSQPSEI